MIEKHAPSNWAKLKIINKLAKHISRRQKYAAKAKTIVDEHTRLNLCVD